MVVLLSVCGVVAVLLLCLCVCFCKFFFCMDGESRNTLIVSVIVRAGTSQEPFLSLGPLDGWMSPAA